MTLSTPPTKRAPRAVVLLGGQRFRRTLKDVVAREEIAGRVALITCGWQEREEDDEELKEHLGMEAINLRLYGRALEVIAEDAELAASHRQRQQVLRHKQDFYRIRLEHELEANHVIRQRRAPPEVLAEEEHASIASIRALDEYHREQCVRVNQAFEDENLTHRRAVVARHREELKAILDTCDAVAMAGGHVASMLNRLRLFGLTELLDGQTVFAWAAGAMLMTEGIVLFHDAPPQGPGAAEVLDRGLELVRRVTVFPQPEMRLRLDNRERVSVLARRFAPAECLALPAGAHVTWRDGALGHPVGVQRLLPNGDVEEWGERLPPLPSDSQPPSPVEAAS